MSVLPRGKSAPMSASVPEMEDGKWGLFSGELKGDMLSAEKRIYQSILRLAMSEQQTHAADARRCKHGHFVGRRISHADEIKSGTSPWIQGGIRL